MSNEDQYLDDAEVKKSDGLVTGLVVATTLVLIAAILIVQYAMQAYGAGLFKQ